MTSLRSDAVAGAPPSPGAAVALKEWGAAVHALLDGRQTVLLRKGGIHEKAFVAPEAGGGFLLFPTVAHTHAERTRPEHHDLLAAGDADATADAVVIRAAVHLIGVVEVRRPDALPDISDLHIWTDASVRRDRVEFRPVKPLQVLVVQARPLPHPMVLDRLEAFAGCRSWVDVDLAEGRPRAGAPEGAVDDGASSPVHDLDRLLADLDRVRTALA
jgi:hypothetical protein